jgi:hypothetical protein
MAIQNDPNAANGGTPGSQGGPVYDLRGPQPAPLAAPQPIGTPAAVPAAAFTPAQAAPAAPAGLQVIGQEEIQIAPHPTTNRFPWAPVPNPTVPIYQSVPQQPTPAPPIVELPPVAPVAAVAPAPAPEPASEPQPEPKPVPAPPSPAPITATPPISPELLQQLEATPEPAMEPVPSSPTPAPAPPPIAQPAPPPASSLEQVLPGLTPPTPQAIPQSPQPAPVVKQPERVFRIGRRLQLFYFVILIGFVLGVLLLWIGLGKPTDITQIEFLQPLLNSQ